MSNSSNASPTLADRPKLSSTTADVTSSFEAAPAVLLEATLDTLQPDQFNAKTYHANTRLL